MNKKCKLKKRVMYYMEELIVTEFKLNSVTFCVNIMISVIFSEKLRREGGKMQF